MTESYLVIKALHLISVISWMVGMLYLPRLYVYHVGAVKGGELDNTLKIMEKKLYYFIIIPAMTLTLIFGVILISIVKSENLGTWFHVKSGLLVLLFGFHGFLGKCRRRFANGENKYSARFFRIINEVPTILMILIVLLAVIKPW